MNASRSLCWLVFGTLAFFSLLAPNRTDAQVVRQLTDVKTGSMSYPAIDDTGTDVFVSSSNDPVGTNPSHAFQVLRYAASTGAAAQLTTAPDGTYPGQWSVSVSNDDQWVAFLSRDNPTGQNADRSGEVFVMKRDGTSLQQLTNHPGAGTGEPLMLALAGGGTKVVFVSTANLTGGNSGGHQQLFVVNKDGTGLSQVTSLTGGGRSTFSR
jgi:Tol biopolymer transport system component